MVDFAVLDAAIGGTDSIEARIMKRAAVEPSRSGRGSRAGSGRPGAHDVLDASAGRRSFLRRLQFIEALAVGPGCCG